MAHSSELMGRGVDGICGSDLLFIQRLEVALFCLHVDSTGSVRAFLRAHAVRAVRLIAGSSPQVAGFPPNRRLPAQIRSLGDQQNQINGNIRLNLAQLKRTTNFISEAIKPTGMLGSKSKENSFHYFISVIQTLLLPLRMKTRRQKIYTSVPLQSNAVQPPFEFPSRSASGEPLPLGQGLGEGPAGPSTPDT